MSSLHKSYMTMLSKQIEGALVRRMMLPGYVKDRLAEGIAYWEDFRTRGFIDRFNWFLFGR